MAYPNGRLPASALADVPGEPGARLVAACARDWAWICAEVRLRYGWTPQLTSAGDAYRTYEIQERIFRDRYTTTYSTAVNTVPPRTKPWLGQTWYLRRGQHTAATPGQSNHGQGVAVDVTGLGPFDSLRYRQFADVATEAGWSNAEGRSIGEPWHWTKTSAVLVGNETTGPGGVDIDVPELDPPDPLEEDMPSPQEFWSYVLPGGMDAAGALSSIRGDVSGVHRAVVGADAAENARDAEDRAAHAGIVPLLESIRAEVDGVHRAVVGSDAVTRDQLTRQAAQIDALTAVVKALSGPQGVDPDAVLDLVRDALTDARITLSSNGA